MNISRSVGTGLLILVFTTLCSPVKSADFSDAITLLKSKLGLSMMSVEVDNYLKPLNLTKDTNGNEFVYFQKQFNDIPVYGERKLVIFPENSQLEGSLNTLRSFSKSELVALTFSSTLDKVAAFSAERAVEIAKNDLTASNQVTDEALPRNLHQATQLVYYRLNGEYFLAYVLRLPALYNGMNTPVDYFIHATEGRILNKIFMVYDVNGKGYGLTDDKLKTFPVKAAGDKGFKLCDDKRSLKIYVANKGQFSTDKDNLWDHVGSVRSDNQKAEVECYLNFVKTIDYYKLNHGFTWGGGNKDVFAVVHQGTNYNNAYFHPWYGGFFFGDGSGDKKGFDYLTKGLDVIGHEFTHGVINESGGLQYSGEPGALNEHIADLFGAMVDGDDWMMGDAITIGDNLPLRNMMDPTNGKGELLKEGVTYNEWRTVNQNSGIKGRIYPDRVSRRIVCTSSEDNGGVHLNSNIFNKFAYLVSTGKEIAQKGLGRKNVASIYYRLLKDKYLPYSCSWNEFKDAFIAAATLEFDGNEDKESYMKTVEGAFAAIELF